MSADRDRETRLAEAREEIARWLFHKVTRRDGLTKLQWEHLHYEEQQTGWLGWADELLALPALRAAGEGDRLRRDLAALAEELRAEIDDPSLKSAWRPALTYAADRLTALLDGGEGGR